jgi:hypothetical protein
VTTRKLEYSRGEIVADRYEIVDQLEESPLGISYRAKHIKTGKYVRMLFLRPRTAGVDQKDEIVDAFKRAKNVQHVNLIRLGELGEHQGVAYYTMEDFDGVTLRDFLQKYKVENKALELKEAAAISLGILEGVQAAHDAGILFRALRPEHVLVNARWTGPRRQNFVAQVKVLGAAFWDLVPSALLAEDEFTKGEAQYMAPELKSLEPIATVRCDVYSTAVMFYEMLVGTAPVGTFQLPRVRRTDLPVHVDNIVELALANSPDDRYPTARDLITDIQRIFQDLPADEGGHGVAVSPMVWMLGLATVAIVSVILFNLRTDPRKEAEAADSHARKAAAEGIRSLAPEEMRALLDRHPANMVYIPGGTFVRGRMHVESADVAREAEHLAEVFEVKPFLIDALEFPNQPGVPPVNKVAQTEAERLCATVGKRLCTADEWEKACKGPKNTIYAYGDTYDEEFCGPGIEAPYPSGTRRECHSGYGVFDLSGNYAEWTSTQVPGKDRFVVKGGLKANPERGTRCAQATDLSSKLPDATLSVRCCRDVDAPPPPPPPDPAADPAALPPAEGAPPVP